eukprot:scaffold180452_cov33-Tisochrysis_lutea.AAC.1
MQKQSRAVSIGDGKEEGVGTARKLPLTRQAATDQCPCGSNGDAHAGAGSYDCRAPGGTFHCAGFSDAQEGA